MNSLLCKYRTELMGLSIILIMLFHSSLCLEKNIITRLFNKCDIGVEFFLILSAIGIYSSLNKNQNLYGFYYKRLLRIIPTYLIIAIPIYIYIGINESYNINRIILDITTITCLKGQIKYWFIHLIIILYLISPIYYNYIKIKHSSIVIPFIALISCYILSIFFPSYNIVLLRIPIYLLGFHLANYMFVNNEIPTLHFKTILFFLIFTCCFLYLLTYTNYSINIYRTIYFLLSIPMLISLAYFIQYLPKRILNILSFFGKITLQLYMIHESIGLVIGQKIFGYYSIFSIVTSFLVAIPLAYCLNKLVNSFISK